MLRDSTPQNPNDIFLSAFDKQQLSSSLSTTNSWLEKGPHRGAHSGELTILS